jgi:dTDP-4-dehydrorhamnose 3,5-epimerase
MIDGIQIIPLKQFPDERGNVQHMLKCTDDHFTKFGEIYFSTTLPGITKAWKRHKLMTQRFAVPQGRLKLVIHDDREGSSTSGNTQEVVLGGDNYQLVIIPPKLWYGFQCISEMPAVLANCSDMPHDPGESEQVKIEDANIQYEWKSETP